jgi:hypothetical protein
VTVGLALSDSVCGCAELTSGSEAEVQPVTRARSSATAKILFKIPPEVFGQFFTKTKNFQEWE